MDENEDTDMDEIKQLLVNANHYSYLTCGRHFKNGVNMNNLKLFYNEFVSYGASTKNDSDLLKILSKLFD